MTHNSGTYPCDSVLPQPWRLKAPQHLQKLIRAQRSGPKYRALRDLFPRLRQSDARRLFETVLLIELAQQIAAGGQPQIAVVLLAHGGPWTWRIPTTTLAENAARMQALVAEAGGCDLQTAALAAMRALCAPGASVRGLMCRPAEILVALAWDTAQGEIRRIIHEVETGAIVLIYPRRVSGFDVAAFATGSSSLARRGAR